MKWDQISWTMLKLGKNHVKSTMLNLPTNPLNSKLSRLSSLNWRQLYVTYVSFCSFFFCCLSMVVWILSLLCFPLCCALYVSYHMVVNRVIIFCVKWCTNLYSLPTLNMLLNPIKVTVIIVATFTKLC